MREEKNFRSTVLRITKIRPFVPGEDRLSERTPVGQNSTCPFRLLRRRRREKWNGWRSRVFGDIPQIKTAQDEVCHWKKTCYITILRRCEELDWGEPQGWVQLRSQVCSPKTNAVALRSRTHSGLPPGLAPAGNSSNSSGTEMTQNQQNQRDYNPADFKYNSNQQNGMMFNAITSLL